MGNILFQGNNQQNNSITTTLDQVRSSGSSNAVFNQMYNNNPAFRQFANSMRNKTPEQAFAEAGLNFNQVKHLKW